MKNYSFYDMLFLLYWRNIKTGGERKMAKLIEDLKSEHAVMVNIALPPFSRTQS